MSNPEGFTPELERICAETCAEFGDPPCWRLPDLVEPCEHISPCEDCLSKSGAKQLRLRSIASLIAVAFMVTPAHADTLYRCGNGGPIEHVTRDITDRGYHPINMGVAVNYHLIEVWQHPDTGAFIMTFTDPGGTSCVLAEGDYWEALPPPGEDPL